jgi:hypothetical protein
MGGPGPLRLNFARVKALGGRGVSLKSRARTLSDANVAMDSLLPTRLEQFFEADSLDHSLGLLSLSVLLCLGGPSMNSTSQLPTQLLDLIGNDGLKH